MCRDGVLEHVGGNQYRYTGHAFHFRSLSSLSAFKQIISTSKRFKHYPGIFIWQFRNKQRRELLEPPDKMAERLNL